MMSGRVALVVAILLGSGVLFAALKWGAIGGGGAGAERDKNPFNYWLGVSITGVGTLLMIIILIGTFVAPDRFHVD